MPRNATVPSEATPAATPSQPSQAGSPPRIAAIEAGTISSAAATPARAEQEPADVVVPEVGLGLGERPSRVVGHVDERRHPDDPAEREAQREDDAADQEEHRLRLGGDRTETSVEPGGEQAAEGDRREAEQQHRDVPALVGRAYRTTSAGVSPVSSLAGETISTIRPATRPSPPSGASRRPQTVRAPSWSTAALRVSSVVVMLVTPLSVMSWWWFGRGYERPGERRRPRCGGSEIGLGPHW